MLVYVKLYATLRKYAPPEIELGEAFEVHIEKKQHYAILLNTVVLTSI